MSQFLKRPSLFKIKMGSFEIGLKNNDLAGYAGHGDFGLGDPLHGN